MTECAATRLRGQSRIATLIRDLAAVDARTGTVMRCSQQVIRGREVGVF
ncbi:hypothetical protein [Gemmobacter serpentinus]|nr:hypothetical protein [Gemmobacter serpentinus]